MEQNNNLNQEKSGRKLGYYLIEAGLITSDRVDEALIEQRTNLNMQLGEILVERGSIKQNTLDYFGKKIIESDSTQTKINLEQKQNQHKYVD